MEKSERNLIARVIYSYAVEGLSQDAILDRYDIDYIDFLNIIELYKLMGDRGKYGESYEVDNEPYTVTLLMIKDYVSHRGMDEDLNEFLSRKHYHEEMFNADDTDEDIDDFDDEIDDSRFIHVFIIFTILLLTSLLLFFIGFRN